MMSKSRIGTEAIHQIAQTQKKNRSVQALHLIQQAAQKKRQEREESR